MATQQDTDGVPFSIAHSLQQFRLLELPPEIVELLDAPNPRPLSIKSQTPSASGPPAYAVLCTSNQTFQLRQVQTSNSLYVTQPAFETHGNEIPVPVTCAIASCATALEAHPATTSAVTLLKETLPVYDIVAGDADAKANGKSKTSIFQDLPVSDGECEAAWKGLMAFELDGSTYQPSASTLSQLWRSINAAALAEAIKLDTQFLTDDITRAVAEDGHPPGLVETILARLSRDDEDSKGPWSCLDRAKTVVFAGSTLLAAKSGADFLIADFTDAWEDRLPEPWRKDAQLSTIEGLCEFPSETTIKATGSGGAVAVNESANFSTKPSARKWHEKFGKTRKK